MSRPTPWICALALVALGASCSRAKEPLPSIVLITVDTLRADHLGCYGYFRPTSPRLDALAAEGVLFEQHISTIGTTLPAHISLMTGLYPHQHGYLTNSASGSSAFRSQPDRRPVAEVLKRAGYTTAAFVSGPTVGKGTGIDAGFDHFDQHTIRDFSDIFDFSRRAGETNAKVLEWLKTKPSTPFFLWVHYWDPHEPNRPPEPYASMFRTDERLEQLLDERRIHPEVLRERFSDEDIARIFAPELLKDLREGRPVELPVIDRAAVADLINRYDGDVRYVDDRMGELFDALRERELLDESIVVVTSDHGQALGQHDWLEHGVLQLHVTHVPLVMRFPERLGVRAGRRAGAVSIVDIMPTVLGRLDRREFRDFLAQAQGEDLLAERSGRGFAFSQRTLRDRAWGEGEAGSQLLFALTQEGWRYYHRPEGQDQLYDIARDPGELADVAAQHPERVSAYQGQVRRVIQTRPFRPSGEGAPAASAENIEMLKTLGYLGDE